MTSHARHRAGIIASAIAVCLLVGASGWVVVHRHAIQDWLTVQRLDAPSEDIVRLAERTRMSDQGKRVFFASQPVIDKATSFNTNCDRREVTAAVLGCYRDRRIYVYDVENEELDGIEEVTAAHEMLHAAWDRLSGGEREKIGRQLEAAYNRVKTPELETRMSYYERQQPGERINELHSIIGTEIDDVGDDLEAYYSRYFDDRKEVVALHRAYHRVFVDIQEKTKQLEADIMQSARTLNARIAKYNKAVKVLNEKTEQHNNQLEAVDRTSAQEVAAYNTRREQLQSEREQLDAERKKLDKERAAYDALVAQYNTTVLRSERLTSSIDSYK